jgi:hypothetical protein
MSLIFQSSIEMKNIVITLTVREYYEFKHITRSYIYIGYTHGKIVVAANEYLLQALGY